MPKPDDFVRIRAMATSTLLTIEDFELLPAEAAENHELVEGELV